MAFVFRMFMKNDFCVVAFDLCECVVFIPQLLLLLSVF